MENFMVAAGAVAPLMVYLFIGLWMKRLYHFTEKDTALFNKLVFGLFLPVNMLSAVYYTDLSQMPSPSLFVFSAAALLLFYVLDFLFVIRVEKNNKRRGAMIQAIYRSNFVLLGAPLVENIYGPEALPVPLMLIAVIIPIYNVLAVFTLETFRGGTFDLKKVLLGVCKNPMILGAVLGGILRLLPFPLPDVFNKCIHALSAGTTPFALVVLGASFTLQGAVSEIRDLLICIAARLVVAPLFFVTAAVGLMGFHTVNLAAILAMAATPSAVASFAMAQQMDSDGELAGNCVIFSSALSCVTMFLWVYGLKVLGLL